MLLRETLSAVLVSAVLVSAALLSAGGALAQDAPTLEAEPEPAPAPAPEELTEEEQRALEEAIGLDAAEASDAAPSPPPPETGANTPEPASPPSPTAAPSAFSQAAAGAQRMLQSMNPNMSFILDVAGAWFSPPFSVLGPGGEAFGNYQLGAHDPSQTGFNLQQLELHVESAVDPFFTFQANIVFAKFGVEVEEAYATTLSLPFGFQGRVGQFLTRFGRTNATHPHMWHFVDQPLVNGKYFGGEGNRGLGVEVSWLAPLPWYVEVMGSVNEAVDACCARSFFGGEGLPVVTPFDLLFTGTVKQFFPAGDDLSVLWGLSAQSGPNPSGKGNRTEIAGTDLFVRWRPVDSPGRTSLSWTTEAIIRRYQIPGSVLMDAGFYSQLVWQLLLQYELGVRVEGVTGAYDDPLDPDWNGLRTRTSAQVTYYPSHFSRLRGQVSYGADGPYDLPLYLHVANRPVLAAFVAFEIVVGAHGSHGF